MSPILTAEHTCRCGEIVVWEFNEDSDTFPDKCQCGEEITWRERLEAELSAQNQQPERKQ